MECSSGILFAKHNGPPARKESIMVGLCPCQMYLKTSLSHSWHWSTSFMYAFVCVCAVWNLSLATLRHPVTPQWITSLNTWPSDWLWRSWEETQRPVLLMWRQLQRNSTPSTYPQLETSSLWVHTHTHAHIVAWVSGIIFCIWTTIHEWSSSAYCPVSLHHRRQFDMSQKEKV